MALWVSVVITAAFPAYAEQTLNYGLHQNKPLNFQDSDGQVKGLVVDVFSHVANKEGWKVNYQPCQWADCLSRLKKGEIDVLSAIGYTQKRSDIYDFTKTPVITNWGLVVTPPKTKIQSLIDLNGHVVAVMKKAGHTRAFKEMLSRFRVDVVYLELDSFKEVMEAVGQKRADAGVVNRLFASQFSSEFNVRESSIIFNPIEIRYAFSKGKHAALVETLDQHLVKLREKEGSIYYQSLERWFGKASDGGVALWLKWAVVISVATGAILLVITLLLNFEVKRKSKALEDEKSDHSKTAQESEALFEAIVKSGPVSLLITEAATGELIYVNERARSLLDISPEETDDRYFMIDFFESKDRRNDLRKMLDEGGYLRDQEVRMKRSNGQVFWASVTATPMIFKGQNTIATSILDITERKSIAA